MFKAAKPSPYRRIALVGPAGSGKTTSALALAAALGERVAWLSLERPWPPDSPVVSLALVEGLGEVLAGLNEACTQGFPVVVLDCLSSLYYGPTGLMALVDQQGNRGWSALDGELAKLYSALHAYPGHILATFRAEEIRLVQEKDGAQRVVSQCGKVAFKADFGANFNVILEMSQGTADCKKGPPIAYNRLFPFPGAELAALLSPASAPQASPPAAEVALPQEADPETPAHPSETGIGTPSSGNRSGPGSSDMGSELDLDSLRRKAIAVFRQGVSSADIRAVLGGNGGEFDAEGKLCALPPERRPFAWGQLENLRSLLPSKEAR
jgi:DNA polymerase III delta prime subunit